VTGRGDKTWLAGLASTLAEVDELLRSPAGHVALEEFYQARGRIAPGYDAGLLTGDVSFTALWLRGKPAPHARRS
jgi:hypothetical protein